MRLPKIGVLQARVRWSFLEAAGLEFITSVPDGATNAQPKTLRRDHSGVAAIEYAVISSLIALSIVGAVASTGGKVQNTLSQVNQQFDGGTTYTNSAG